MVDTCFVLADVDDHSRFCVSAHLVFRETSGRVCEGLAVALRAHGVPEEVLQFFDGDTLLRTEQRRQRGEVRKKNSSVPGGQHRRKVQI